MSRELDSKKSTLDFGCGIGQYSVLFDAPFYLGVDTDEQCITTAKKKYPEKMFVLDESNDLSFLKKKFEQLILFATIHHLDDASLTNLVNQFSKVLNDRGRILVLDPYPVADQKTLFGKFLFSLDRGKFARSSHVTINFFKPAFSLIRQYNIKLGPYNQYVLLLEKKS